MEFGVGLASGRSRGVAGREGSRSGPGVSAGLLRAGCKAATHVSMPRVALLSCLAVAAAACTGQGAAMPTPPEAAILDAYDATALANTSAIAPTFAEVAAPRDDSPRRFRAWLGWGGPECPPCPADDTMHCGACAPGRPYVCARPSRVVACEGEDIVSTNVGNGDEPVPMAGAYVLEGHWETGGFAVTRVASLGGEATTSEAR